MNNALETISGTSLDISAENRSRLKQLFPSVFTETVNEKGELTESLDFEKLKAELGTFTDLFEARRERYGMDWPGKKDALRLIQTPSAATLKPCREESVDFDTTENLFIEGDNLEVLKLLQKSYYGKVKMIYIDPPYNTGKEFIYPDNYSESLETYLEYAGLIDGDGKKFSTNTANEGRFHTKWLNMMYPRLYLARNLLRDDGVIFISIDDNEVSNLRKLCDEIFGEENFVGLITINGNPRGRDYGGIARMHDYLLVFAKSVNAELENLPDEDKEFEFIDVKGGFDIRELRNRNIAFNSTNRPNLYYPFYINPKNKDENGFYEISLEEKKDWLILYPKESQGLKTVWRWGKELSKFNLNKEIVAKSMIDGGFQIVEKYRKKTRMARSIWFDRGVNTEKGTLTVKNLFDGGKYFSFPKPVEFITRCILMASYDSDIILDFFAGSGTTAHAVLDLNKDGHNRKFILVQLPEPCAEDSEAFKAGYKTITEIGKERIRRVIKKLNEADEGRLALDEPQKQDRGFKALKLDKSNFKPWQKLTADAKPEQIFEQLQLHIDYIDDKATSEDLLFEILIKSGFMPTEKVQSIMLADIPVFSIADGGLLICLADNVTKELINAVAEAEPMQFICLDSAFGGNDQLKTNAVQTFAARNMGRDKANQIIFRTV